MTIAIGIATYSDRHSAFIGCKMAFGLTWFVGYNSHLAFHYFYFKSKLFMGLQICPISIIILLTGAMPPSTAT
jgi:hypothetical protein